MAALNKFLGASNVVPIGFWNENKNENIKEIWLLSLNTPEKLQRGLYSWKITKRFLRNLLVIFQEYLDPINEIQ